MHVIPEEYSLLIKPGKLEKKNIHTIHRKTKKSPFINQKHVLALKDILVSYSREGDSQSIRK